MKMIERFVGLDVRKDTITVAVAEGRRQGELRVYGRISSDLRILERTLRKIRGEDGELHVVYEAGLVEAAGLAAWPWTSLNWVCEPRGRSAWFRAGAALGHAGGLGDTPDGRRAYVAYLGWLAANEPEQRALCFERMSKGWAVGTVKFQAGLVREHREAASLLSGGLSEARERREEVLGVQLASLGKGPADVRASMRRMAKGKA